MKFSEMLVEYLYLKDKTQFDNAEEVAERNDRMDQLLEEMDWKIAKASYTSCGMGQ